MKSTAVDDWVVQAPVAELDAVTVELMAAEDIDMLEDAELVLVADGGFSKVSFVDETPWQFPGTVYCLFAPCSQTTLPSRFFSKYLYWMAVFTEKPTVPDQRGLLSVY